MGLEPAISNVKSLFDALETRIRVLCSAQRKQDKLTAIHKKAKGCAVCQGRGYVNSPGAMITDHDLAGYMPFGSKFCDCQ